MQSKETQDYSNAMIEAFIDKPEKTLWYQMAFSKFNANGIDKPTWHWSWWGFFGGFLFLLYRKAYIPALILFIASMTIGMIPFGGLLLMILSGGYSTYFIYKVYKDKLLQTEMLVDDYDKRIQTMRELGGYNQWVIWVYAIFMSIIILGMFFTVLIPLLAM
ncbi:MAG: DUF2628 domain-containing protein [Sulfurimonas sp.]|nr:DUF2628 domain-containing protein [Sulfurimonas sp.]